jgi:hypothetical protein
METIQTVFQQVQALFSENSGYSQVLPQLDDFDLAFRSIAYEAASMCIALKDLAAGDELTNWFIFLNGNGALHATQVHVGLGWALAQQQLNPLNYLAPLTPMMRYRVLDGYGYYEGIFRRRKAIIAKQLPTFNDVTALSAYCQGLGRSIWYINKGEVTGAKIMIEGFAQASWPDLWRGLGIAITYVGGCTIDGLNQIWAAAGPYRAQLQAGAAMATISRYNAGYFTPSSKIICGHWLKQNEDELVTLNKNLISKIDLNANNAYAMWLSRLEKSFAPLD